MFEEDDSPLLDSESDHLLSDECLEANNNHDNSWGP